MELAVRVVLAGAVFHRIAVKKRGDVGAPVGAPRVSSFTRADGVALMVATPAYVAMLFLHTVSIGMAVIGR